MPKQRRLCVDDLCLQALERRDLDVSDKGVQLRARENDEGELVSDQEWDPSARSPTPQKKTKRKRGRPRKHPKPED